MKTVLVTWCCLGFLGTTAALAQEMRLLDCYDVSPFGPGCGTVAPPVLPPAPAPSVPSSPLFTKETMSPDTPPLVLEMLNNLTVANVDAFVQWQAQRLQRLQEATALLKVRTELYLKRGPR